MTTRRTPSRTLAAQSTELALAAPFVVAQRLARMALAGASPSAGDRRETARMSREKVDAFRESWAAMGWEMFRLQQRYAWSLWGSFMQPWRGAAPGALTPDQIQRAALGLASAGMGPVHRRAVANAKRLSGRRR